MAGNIPENIKNLSFEDSLKQLEAIVRRLESGEAPLEESIDDYAKGDMLRQHCEKKLGDARMKVEKIIRSSNGSVNTEKFEE